MKANKLYLENNSRRHVLLNMLKAAFGLFLFGVGSYLTIQAGIGTGPWDTLNIGFAKTLGTLYGTASIIVSFLFIIMDIILREPIGLGMFIDAILVGKTVDLLNYLEVIPKQSSLIPGILIMLIGVTIQGYSQFIYMSAGLGCGPRDAFLIGIYKKSNRIPVAVYSIALLSSATLIGWLLGGTIGIGTLMGAFLTGPIMQLSFHIMHMNPGKIIHQNFWDSLKIIFPN